MENETRKFSTLQELLDALYYDTVSAEIISEKRACIKDGASYECCNYEIPEASEQHFWKEIAKVIWSKPTEANINALKHPKAGGSVVSHGTASASSMSLVRTIPMR